MSYEYSDNELDNALFEEFTKENPSEQIVRELIAKGANVNAIEKYSDSILMHVLGMMSSGERPIDFSLIQFIIDLGVDINYLIEGFNCLYIAALTYNADLVELLLKNGANPNCYSIENGESLLDWASFEHGFAEMDYGEESAKEMKQVVDVLEKHGAKFSRDLYAEKPEKQLDISASYDTGLFTYKGNLRIEQIPNTDENLITEFNEWLENNPDNWPEYRKNKYLTNPEILEQHNKQGLILAKQIKQLVGNDIVVFFVSVDVEELKNKQKRHLNRIIIE